MRRAQSAFFSPSPLGSVAVVSVALASRAMIELSMCKSERQPKDDDAGLRVSKKNLNSGTEV